jgi:uncharacterized protein YndB with AHSA1/START domain
MTPPTGFPIDPERDLVLQRVLDVPPAKVWEAWTRPEHLKEWFVPKPWGLAECEVDLRPGGLFRTVMRSPEGDLHPGEGCYLEIVPGERLVWTAALVQGFRPAVDPDLSFTAIITLEPEGEGTRYTATVVHRDREACERHEEMGFHQGWGAALDQLVAYAKERM